VESEPGAGSRFTLWLPCDLVAADRPRAVHEEQQRPQLAP